MMRYVRLYSDDGGESHFEDVDVELSPGDFAPPAPPLNLSAARAATRCIFVGAARAWFGDWHPAPERQFFFCLAGEFQVTASDGEVRTFPVGAVLLAEDTTGKGHATRITSNEDALTAVVQLA